MNLHLLWGFVCISLVAPVPVRSEEHFKLHGENVKKVEIGFDLIDGNALITYNDVWRTRGKILYSEKKKIVAYRDEEIGHCLLEKIRFRKERKNEDGELSSSVHYISATSLEKVKAEKLAGKKLVSFCGKYPITLLKESSAEGDRGSEKMSKYNERRKRETDLIRGNESQLSHQEISKKLLDDLANAEGLVSSRTFSTKGVKRNADGGNEHGVGHHPSASAKVGQPATVDYHARIRNNLPSGAHPLHPIDITSSVTIATGASHPVWSYSPSAGSHFAQNSTGSDQGISPPHGIPHHSPLMPSQQNNSQIHHQHSTDLHGQAHQQGAATHPSPGQPIQTSGYYPPSSASKSQQNNVHYSPSFSSKTHSPQYIPSSYNQPQQNTGYYLPPSSTSKTQHVPSHFPPSSVSKSQQGPANYPPSSSSKSHHPSSSLVPQPGPAYYPPSSFSKTHATFGGHGIQSSLNGKNPLTVQYPPNSHSTPHGYHQSHVPPSSTSKIHYSVPQPQNTSHSSFHHGGVEQGRGVHTAQLPPSSTSKVYQQPGQYENGGRSGTAQYPPSSTSKLHHSTPNGGHGGPQDHSQGVPQYPPSSTSKVAQPGSLYAPQFPPSSTSKVNYFPDNRDSFYGHTPVLERPSVGGNAQEPGTYPPSSASKVHYSPHSHVMAAGGNGRGVPYYPPSSSSKTHYSLSSSGQDHHPISSYPPSSTSKQHYSHSSASGSPAQIPQLPTDRNLGFPPSSTSKLHSSPFNHAQHYPPSSSSKLPHAHASQSVQTQSHNHQSPVYYPPSPSQHHQTHHNFSSTKELSTPGYYAPSSISNLHHSPVHQDTQTTGRVTATGRVSVTPSFSYYPPSSSSKNGFVQQGQHLPSSHPIQQYPYYGPPSPSSHHRNGSIGRAPSGIPPSSPGHGSYSPTYYPPSSSSKIHPSQQNGSLGDNNMHSKSFYPMEQYPSSSGGQYHPLHHNDSSSGQFSHPSQGGYYSPSEHHSSPGGGYLPQYPPSSTAHNSQQPLGGSQPEFYQSLTPSQGSQSTMRPCQSSPRSLYSITTRTILTPNGAVQRPVSVQTNGEYPCGGVGQATGGFPYARYAPCSGTLTRNGQTVRPPTPCTSNGNLRKTMRNVVPGPAVAIDRNGPQHAGNVHNIRNGKEHHQRGYGHSAGAAITNVETQTELLHGPGHHHRSQFSKLQAAENSTSETITEDTTGPEHFEENGKSGKDVEVFEKNEGEEEMYRSVGKPVKYQENETGNKTEETKTESEEEVREGDVLEPGDRILGKDGYTILDGFRGRVVSVTGQIGKTKAETGKESRATIPQESEKKSNSGQFRYSSDLGRYVKENGEKNYSNCQGEPTFTCSEFLGSNGRAKICKPNPRRNPDGSPC